MEFKTRLKQIFKNRILKPQLNRMDAWEKMVIDHPDASAGWRKFSSAVQYSARGYQDGRGSPSPAGASRLRTADDRQYDQYSQICP